MAHLTIRVPEQHVDQLRSALLHAHARCADALAGAATRYRASHAGLDALEGALIEVRDLHDAIEQLGWTAARPRDDVVLTAHAEAIWTAIDPGAMPAWLRKQLRAPHEP